MADIADAEGRAFSAFGRKTSCYSRMCPHCIKDLQRKAQRRLIAARNDFWKDNQREPGKFERFVTLTGPTLQGVALEESNEIYNRAFALLADSSFWSSRVEAGAKHVEFTINPHGYHTHIHLLVYGSYIERDAEQEAKSRQWRSERAAKREASNLRIVGSLPSLGNLQDQWTRCITQAVREFGREIEWDAAAINQGWYSRFPLIEGELVEVQPTTAAGANVDVRMVREKGRPSDEEIGLPSAVKELTKYITKASSWSEVSDEQLVAIAEVKRWPRCFELLGEWRRTKAPVSVTELPAQVVLHIRLGETWEDFCKRVTRENGHPHSYVIAWDQIAVWDARSDVGTLYAASGGDTASLDTDFLSPTSLDPSESPPPEKVFIRPRSPSLMELGERMNFDEWLKLVSIRVAEGRRARARLLAKKYPETRFYCLDGSQFGGAIGRIGNSAERIRSVGSAELKAA
ncbi:MAG: protein rep [Acidobacteriota bacterium]